MITYFSEQDLVSFGNFIISPTRRKAYLEQDIEADKVDELLLNVNPFDLTTWFNIVIKAQQDEAKGRIESNQDAPQEMFDPLA